MLVLINVSGRVAWYEHVASAKFAQFSNFAQVRIANLQSIRSINTRHSEIIKIAMELHKR